MSCTCGCTSAVVEQTYSVNSESDFTEANFDPSLIVSAANKVKYLAEGIATDSDFSLLLRVILDYEVCIQALRIFAGEDCDELFECWSDVHCYKNRPEVKMYHSFGVSLCGRYIFNPGFLQKTKLLETFIPTSPSSHVASNNDEEHACKYHFTFEIETCPKRHACCPMFPSGFDWLLRKVFMIIFHRVFMPFITVNENLMKLCKLIDMSSKILHSVDNYTFERLLGKCIALSDV